GGGARGSRAVTAVLPCPPARATLPALAVDAETCRDLERGASLEWLETNGLGGYACGTASGLRTRRYHGLLVAAARPPAERRVLLAALDVVLHLDDRRIDLGVARYGDVVHPDGHRRLAGFRVDPFPTRTWSDDDWELDEELFMPHGRDAVVIRWRLKARPTAHGRTRDLSRARLEVRPLIAFRDDHALTRRNDVLRGDLAIEPGRVRVRPYDGLPSLAFAHDAARVARAGVWYERVTYVEERARGFDHVEDLFNPCALEFALGGPGEATLVATLDDLASSEVCALRAAEVARREALAAAAPSTDDATRLLAVAADRFVVRRGASRTIVAGYPWFVDWGRDAMIALPGLLLATRRFDDAREVLRTFAAHLDGGMLPNRFPDVGETPEYNSVDAALWFVEAARAFLAATGDRTFALRTLLPAIRAIAAAHLAGTRHGVRVDAEGFLRAGAPGVQLTWMDAKVGDHVVTPRGGRPVEIQALWFNALRVLAAFERLDGAPGAAAEADARAETLRAAFARTFWNPTESCLYDVVDDDGAPDPSVRPNQIFAVSLHHALVDGERARAVVRRIERDLLTPVGLRTLAPDDARYAGRYEGGPEARDRVYHQGAAWPWLLGPFLEASLRVHGRSRGATVAARRRLEALLSELRRAGLGSLSELHDGDRPHAARGCFAQAWSVAEALRLSEILA
ncbi:MAG TPA: amylo-alpha-1,6-glucosidase, partial [Planctomycetota bacterium]|nr:amylo-alpha-1,6-glucosidase [Planctomycetota bacterium]